MNAGAHVVGAAALDAAELETGRVSAMSARFVIVDGVVPATVSLDGFLPHATGAHIAGERASIDAVDGASMMRIRLDDGAGAEWNVWARGAASFVVEDHHPDVNVAAPRALRARLEAFVLEAGYDDVVAPGGVMLDRLTVHMQGWSAVELPPP